MAIDLDGGGAITQQYAALIVVVATASGIVWRFAIRPAKQALERMADKLDLLNQIAPNHAQGEAHWIELKSEQKAVAEKLDLARLDLTRDMAIGRGEVNARIDRLVTRVDAIEGKLPAHPERPSVQPPEAHIGESH